MPHQPEHTRAPPFLMSEMDRFGVEMGMVPVTFDEPIGRLCVERYPECLLAQLRPDLRRASRRSLPRPRPAKFLPENALYVLRLESRQRVKGAAR